MMFRELQFPKHRRPQRIIPRGASEDAHYWVRVNLAEHEALEVNDRLHEIVFMLETKT
jgi:hypothetical protein